MSDPIAPVILALGAIVAFIAIILVKKGIVKSPGERTNTVKLIFMLAIIGLITSLLCNIKH